MATAKTKSDKSSKSAPVKPTKEPKAKEKKEKVAKVDYPGLVNSKGEVTLLDDWPTDHDNSKHKPIKRTAFKCESIWFLHQADQAEAKAADYRAKAEEAKTLGSSKDGAKAKKLLSLMKKQKELAEQLKAAGVDVDALVSSQLEAAPTAKDQAAE